MYIIQFPYNYETEKIERLFSILGSMNIEPYGAAFNEYVLRDYNTRIFDVLKEWVPEARLLEYPETVEVPTLGEQTFSSVTRVRIESLT